MVKGISVSLFVLAFLSCSPGQVIKENIVAKPSGVPVEVNVHEIIRADDGIYVTLEITNRSAGSGFLVLAGALLLKQGQSAASIEAGKTKVDYGQIAADVRWRRSALSGLQNIFMYSVGKSAHVLELDGNGDSGVRTLYYSLPADFQPTEIFFHEALNATIDGSYKKEISFTVEL